MHSTPYHCKLRIGLFGIVWLMIYSSPAPDFRVEGCQPPSTKSGSQETGRIPGKDDAPVNDETPSNEEEMKGVVEKVIDGDSIKVREEGGSEVHEVQLEGTDAPETMQSHGMESTEALRKMVLDRKVRITWTKKDNFGRRLAQVYVGEEHINRKMIRDGYAWHFKRYNQSKELAQLEEEARKAKRGIWGTENPQAPWDYRKENRTPDKPDR